MIRSVTFIIVFFIFQEIIAQRFQPYEENAKRLVQGISFSNHDSTLLFSLPHKEFLLFQGHKISEKTPRLAIYKAQKEENHWTTPVLLSFSGHYKDYEPTISPNGKILFFNSNRPINGKDVTKTNIWFSEKENDQWNTPKFMFYLNEKDEEQSYPTISKYGKLIYTKEVIEGGKSHYYLFETHFAGVDTKMGNKISFPNFHLNTSDPCISSDGDYLIFTGFDTGQWEKTCDLYISYALDEGWSTPNLLKDLNSDGPDFSPTISSDAKHIYYRKNYNMIKATLMIKDEN
ncbi:hypothetical protein [uncultured Winogradskyella sp.]|uniref:hypothetical protein n=1 Tax=uncultured Winogradskyella sp. TaxID=395353 RepID=UPI00262F9F95|nr:hypothetical protein [uncultured Winogradskyella sp.]